MATIRENTRKDGSRSYHAEVRLKGHKPERATFRTLSQAKKWVQSTESAIRDGRHVRTTEAKRHTVEEMIDQFVEQWLPKHPQRQDKQKSLLTWWTQWCGHLLLADLTPAVIAAGRDQLLGETTVRKTLRSPSTVNRYLSALGKALTVAVKEWGWLEVNPIRNVAKPTENEGRERFLSEEEKQSLLQACAESRNPNLLPIVSVALLTGMRFSEIAGLHWRDIDFKQQKITLLRTKNGDRRTLPLTSDVAAIFQKCPTYGTSLDQRVFIPQQNSTSQKKVSIREAFENAVKRAGIENFRFHDLRHTAASNMAMGGATQGELMAILGHRSPSMTRRYAHYSQGHLSKVMERANNASATR